MNRSGWSLILNYVRGLLMGGADIVPGVSGGTVALIVGIYERLVSSIRAGAAAAVALIRMNRAVLRERLAEVHWGLVLPLLAGIVSAILIGARFIPELLEQHPVEMHALFFGLIVGSLAIPWRRIERPRRSHFLIAALTAVAAFLLVALPPREIADPGLITVFLAASIAICAMILPGLSGSYLLLIMGMYGPTLRALSGRDIPFIAVFMAGAAIGLGLFARLLEYLLDRHHDVMMAALVGLMAGSLRALWPFMDENRGLLPPPGDSTLVLPLTLAVLGFLVVTGLALLGAAVERRETRTADRHERAPLPEDG